MLVVRSSGCFFFFWKARNVGQISMKKYIITKVETFNFSCSFICTFTEPGICIQTFRQDFNHIDQVTFLLMINIPEDFKMAQISFSSGSRESLQPINSYNSNIMLHFILKPIHIQCKLTLPMLNPVICSPHHQRETTHKYVRAALTCLTFLQCHAVTESKG